MEELSINEQNKENFDFAQKGIIPRVLIGLKNGSLLGRNVTEEELLLLGMTKPRLSPNLPVWRTAVNSKLLITGSIGIDPLLVKEKSNFPRFKILMKASMEYYNFKRKSLKQEERSFSLT